MEKYEPVPLPKAKPAKKHLNCVFYDKNRDWAFEVSDPASGSEQRIGFQHFVTDRSAKDARAVQEAQLKAKKPLYSREELRAMGFR